MRRALLLCVTYPPVYVYSTGGGPIRFLHAERYSIDRSVVKAAGIRFDRGMS
jgi:hypothetical protein